MKLLVIVIAIVVVQRLSELIVAKRNYVWAMQHNGIEVGSSHYPLFVVLHAAWILAIIAECVMRGPAVPTFWPIPLALIVAAQVLRYWAIRTLGRFWNTRIIVFNNFSPVTSGPFRFFKHPNYVAVVLEIAAIPALLGAWYTAFVFSFINAGLLLLVRIPMEEQAMRSCSTTGKETDSSKKTS